MSVELAQALEKSAQRKWYEIGKRTVPVIGTLGPGVLTVQRGIKEQPGASGGINHEIKFGINFIGYGRGHTFLGETTSTLEDIKTNPNLRLLSEDFGN